MKRLGISLVGSQPARIEPPPAFGAPIVPPPLSPPDQPGPDIRSFAAAKQPKTLNEKVAVMAFFLSQLAPPGERRDFITSEDIKPYFIQAGFELPTGPANMTLTNAKNAGYLNALERGQYKLNSVGHNLVAHKLPKKEGASSAARRNKPVKRPAKKAKR